MRVLILGAGSSSLSPIVSASGHDLRECHERIGLEELGVWGIDFVVSYGYRHIVKEDVIRAYASRIINLHISLLPWNRGADPNLWSFLEDTPKGVTVHLMDAGLDTGDIIAQREVSFTDPGETLATTYAKLSEEIVALFRDLWPRLLTRSAQARPQPGGGSYHRSSDKAPYMHLLTQGWDTPVRRLTGYATRDLKRGNHGNGTS